MVFIFINRIHSYQAVRRISVVATSMRGDAGRAWAFRFLIQRPMLLTFLHNKRNAGRSKKDFADIQLDATYNWIQLDLATFLGMQMPWSQRAVVAFDSLLCAEDAKVGERRG